MVGIDIDRFDSIMNNSQELMEYILPDLNKLVNVVSGANKCCFAGADISYLFNGVENNEIRIKNMKKMILSYPNVLKSVKSSYITQDNIFHSEVGHIVSKL